MHEEMDDRVKNFETLIKTDIKHKEEQMLKFNKTSLSFASTKLSQSASKRNYYILKHKNKAFQNFQ